MLFKKLRDSLANTTKALTGRIKALVKGRKIDAALWDEVEEILITSDVGVTAADDLARPMKVSSTSTVPPPAPKFTVPLSVMASRIR